MVLGSRPDSGVQTYSYRIRKTIQSIKEIVGNHSDAEIYAMLKETNMDPNETAQKLLYQDPFHEVKRKRDKKKENTGYKVSSEPQKHAEQTVQWTKSYTSWDRNARRGGYVRSTLPDAGISREFRVVRDNRVNQNRTDTKQESVQPSASGNEQGTLNIPEKSSPGILTDQKHSAARNTEGKLESEGMNRPHQSDSGHADSTGAHLKLSEGALATASTTPLAHRIVPQNSQMHSATSASSNSLIGVYSSSSDPVHVPSPDSRSAGTVGAIRREVGVVGVRRQPSEHPASQSSLPNNSFSNAPLGNDISASSEPLGHPPAISKSNHYSQAHASEPITPSISVSRSFSNNQYSSKLHQPPVGHQKAPQSNMEWKPKSNQKSIVGAGVIGTASTSVSSHADNSTGSNVEAACLSDDLSQVNIIENEHVIIPQHLRVPEAERTHLTFGSFGAGFDSSKGFTSTFQTFGNVEDSRNEPSESTSAPVSVGSSEDASAEDRTDLVDGQARTSRSDSPASSAESEHPTPENNDSLSPRNMENYADIGLVQNHIPSYSPLEPQQMQDPASLPSFSEAYDPQPSYEVPFFRTAIDNNVRGQGLASSSEALNSHVANTSPLSSVAASQQQPLAQQQSITQLYPQVHISHFPNFVPYRQLISPLYVPPMAMPNYSSNAAYPHPANGSSYLLMPGGSSHLSAGGMKYATSQYKPVAAGSPTGYGNYTNPAGYAISAPGTVGGTTGLEDVTTIKYKDNNLYVPNPQAETPEIWIQPSRDLSSMQSAPYYNLSGQAPHATYLPTHTGHASFNAAVQSSHVQFPGLYHPPQPATITNPHHMVHQQVPPGMGGNLGVGMAAPGGAQVGTYQQPQLGHLNWTANF